MYNEIIELGKGAVVENATADQMYSYTFREVFAEVRSVSQSEFYNAAQSGFKPAFKFVLADYYDYDEDDTVRYDGVLYHIIRTFRNGMQLEITAEKKIEGRENG